MTVVANSSMKPGEWTVDPVEQMIKRTGCIELHYEVQECIVENQDWRKCQEQVQKFKDCMEEYNKKQKDGKK